MKAPIKLILIATSVLLVFGCAKKEKPQTPPAENVVKTAETNTPPAEHTVETPTPPPAETVVPASQPPLPQADASPSVPENTVELVTAAPLRGLEWVKGGPVTIEPGKVYIIEFWATWCGPCKISIPHLTQIQKQYKDKNLTVIGISNESLKTVKPYVEKMGDQMNYTVAVDAQGFAEKNYMNAFNAQGIPHAFLVDGKGKIVWQGHPLEDLDAVLDQVVQGVFDPAAYAKQKAAAEALQQQAMVWYTDYFRGIEADGLNDEIRRTGAKFIEVAPVDGLNAFAWNILTQVKQQNRDLEAALNAAQKANQLSEGKEPVVLDTYALALFENGKIQEAIDAQQQAVDLLKDNPPVQEQLLQTLKKYKAAQKQ